MIRATFAGFSTALSALQANQKRLDITGQNLANMNTVGYTRQQLETSSLNYTGAVSHYMSNPDVNVGFGVGMDRVSQIRDPYLDAQYRQQMTKSSYNSAMQESLDSLANVLDETNISGLRQAFDDIQWVLNNMQDSSKVNDPIYESELRSKMQALTNLFNSSAKQIEEAEKLEYDKLNGEGTSEQGAVQRVNDILRQLGDLNVQIKKNQVLGQPSLELMDERNVLLDELSSFVPIEVTYYKDAEHSGDKIYDRDKNGNIIGKKNWPDDMKVELLYTDTDGNPQRMTLVNGSDLSNGANYGQLSAVMKDKQGAYIAADRSDPTKLELQFTAAPSSGDKSVYASASGVQFKDGSIQAGLDMLGKTGDGNLINGTATLNDVKGYQYYMGRLDTLANTFVKVINDINNHTAHNADPANANNQYKAGGNLLTNKEKPDDPDSVTAANIGITADWINGKAHLSDDGENPTDTVLDMIHAMTKTDHAGLENKSFTDYMNNISTVLANDSSSNQVSLKTNVTVLNGIQDSKDSISGVSMDEEATNMMAYISAYNAASRLMTTLDEALNTLIHNTGLVGR